MKVEILFPEIGNLYGDLQNVDYLKRSCPNLEVIEDTLVGEPYFLRNTPDLIYMGTLTEKGQELAIDKLKSYRERLLELIKEGCRFLVTGNSLEIFGSEILDKDGTRVECLHIFPTIAERDMMHRFNSLYIGAFQTDKQKEEGSNAEIEIVGYKSQFTHSYWKDEGGYFNKDECGYLFETTKGPGLNPEITEEGIRYKNFMATYLIGPLLILNPPFTKWLLDELDGQTLSLAYEDAAMEAYEERVKEYLEPDRGFYY